MGEDCILGAYAVLKIFKFCLGTELVITTVFRGLWSSVHMLCYYTIDNEVIYSSSAFVLAKIFHYLALLLAQCQVLCVTFLVCFRRNKKGLWAELRRDALS